MPEYFSQSLLKRLLRPDLYTQFAWYVVNQYHDDNYDHDDHTDPFDDDAEKELNIAGWSA